MNKWKEDGDLKVQDNENINVELPKENRSKVFLFSQKVLAGPSFMKHKEQDPAWVMFNSK
jgi:hypothetical protein